MMRGDALHRHVAVWRIADATKEAALLHPAPDVTCEAPTKFAPWDDVVEGSADGTFRGYQIKSGRFKKGEPEELRRSLMSHKDSERVVQHARRHGVRVGVVARGYGKRQVQQAVKDCFATES